MYSLIWELPRSLEQSPRPLYHQAYHIVDKKMHSVCETVHEMQAHIYAY